MTKLGLTLAGGGARGAAHIGVLLEMERLNITPDLVTGTSIGGLIGSLLGSGLGVDAISDFMTELRVINAYARPRHLASLADNRKFETLLEKTIGRPQFSDLNFPLAVVAADLTHQKVRIMNEGDVITAVLATTAIPTILPPVQDKDGSLLVDGGVLNNLPVDIAYEMGADQVLAVDLTNVSPLGAPKETTVEGSRIDRSLARVMDYPSLDILLKTVDMMLQQTSSLQLAQTQPTVLLRPDLGTIGMLDFHRLQEGIEAGRLAFISAETEIKQTLCADADAQTDPQPHKLKAIKGQ